MGWANSGKAARPVQTRQVQPQMAPGYNQGYQQPAYGQQPQPIYNQQPGYAPTGPVGYNQQSVAQQQPVVHQQPAYQQQMGKPPCSYLYSCPSK